MPRNLSDQLLAGGQIDGLRRKKSSQKSECYKGKRGPYRFVHNQTVANTVLTERNSCMMRGCSGGKSLVQQLLSLAWRYAGRELFAHYQWLGSRNQALFPNYP
jgi:hypothetical protein